MLDTTDSKGKFTPGAERSRRAQKSAFRKLVAADPGRLGLASPRQHAPGRLWLGCLAAFGGVLGSLVLIGLALVSLIAAVLVGAFIYFTTGLPPVSQLAAAHIPQSTKIYDRNGNLLFELFDSSAGRRTVVAPDQIATVLKQATIATEDPTFYTNPGIDMQGIGRAVYYLVTTRRIVGGGSTITQQLVKNMLLTPEETFDRKIREAVLALEVTRQYSKEEILGMYLNTVYYGNLASGVEAASKSYFQKDASQVDLAEASLLAGLPQQPSLDDPCRDPDAALARQKVVLGLMAKAGYITDAQANAASEEMTNRLHDPNFSSASCTIQVSQVAPHFVDYVQQQLEQKYGPAEVYGGGLQVYTSLDPAIQTITEQVAREQIAKLKAQNVTNAAVVVADPHDGEIYAMLGSVNFFDKSIDGQVNVADRLRQPGSSIKPINYVTAFEKGWTLATPILDTKSVFPMGRGFPPYVPVNYDHRYHGIVNPRIALANSLNIPAVRTLYFVTVPDMIATAQRFGYTTFSDPSRYGLSITLGGADVKLVEHTGAYAVFADLGKRAPLTPFRKIVDAKGDVLYDVTQNQASAQQVVDPRFAYEITSILSDNQARTPEFGPNSALKLDRPAAAKTGTTNDWRDNWTLGYTPELVVGVWVGNSNNSPMVNSTGITGAAPIWHDVMERIYHEIAPFKDIAPHEFPIPAGLVRVTICTDSGLLPTDACPPGHRRSEIFLAEQAPTTYDRFWNGGWGSTCIPFMGSDGASASGLVSAGGMASYDSLVQDALQRGMPEGLAGLGHCSGDSQPEASNGGDGGRGGGRGKKKR